MNLNGSHGSLTEDGWNKTFHLHVLLAEDNIVNQKVAVRQLQKHGHNVTVVGDGIGALDAIIANHDGYDLVIMDVQVSFFLGFFFSFS